MCRAVSAARLHRRQCEQTISVIASQRIARMRARCCEAIQGYEGVSMKQPCVYIVASGRNGTLYTGVTSNLPKRAFEHREGQISGFSRKYGCKVLVWCELHETMIAAITREKQIKAGSRGNKLALIEELNPGWEDLYDTLI
jgi:putative endonuclease